MCFVTSKYLPESKGKGFDLDFPTNSSSFICNSNCIFFSFSISMRSSVLSFNFSCSIFLFPFLFSFLSLVLHF